MITIGTLVIWAFSRLDHGTRMYHIRIGSTRVRAPVWTASGMGHWKRLNKISSRTDCYYCINHMTCPVHVYYCPFILVTVLDILSTTISCVYLALHVETQLSCTLTLHFMYPLFHICFVNTMLLNSNMVDLRNSSLYVHIHHDTVILL